MANNQTNQQNAGEFDPFVQAGIVSDSDKSKDMADTAHAADETARKVYKAGPGRFVNGIRGKKSIIGMAAKNTFEFPVFVSKSIPLDYATATNSLLEQIYASYLQMAISLNPVIDSKTASNGGPFSNFKTNITKYVEYTDMFYAHDACYASYQDDEYMMEFNMISITDNEASIINESVDYQPLSEFDHYFQEGKKYTKADLESEEEVETDTNNWDDSGQSTGSSDSTTTRKRTASNFDVDEANARIEKIEKDIDKVEAERLKILKEKEHIEAQLNNDKEMNPLRKEQLEKQIKHLEKQQTLTENQADYIKQQWLALGDEYDLSYTHKDGTVLDFNQAIIDKRIKLMYDKRLSAAQLQKALDDIEHSEKRWKMEREKHKKDMMVRGPQFLDESKIQKLNTMKPLMMQVQLKVMDKKGGISEPMEYIVGVKTHCRLIDPETLPEVVNYPLKKMDKLTRKAKWRAGEIKFFDYLFNIKEKKQTAIDSRDPKRKWYRRLYELAHKKGDANVAARISGNRTSGLIPNATIMVAQTDVDNIKASTNINLLRGSAARDLCRELFLMAFIVIDLDSESIKILLPDINNDYEVHSLASVKKQLATLDTSGDKTRDMFKLLGK